MTGEKSGDGVGARGGNPVGISGMTGPWGTKPGGNGVG